MMDVQRLEELLSSVLGGYILTLPDPPSVIPNLLQERRPVSLVSFLLDLIPQHLTWTALQAAGIVDVCRKTAITALDLTEMITAINNYQRVVTIIFGTKEKTRPWYSRALTDVIRGAGDICRCAWATLKLVQRPEISHSQREAHRAALQRFLWSLLCLEKEKGHPRTASDLYEECGELDEYELHEKLQYEGNGRLLLQQLVFDRTPLYGLAVHCCMFASDDQTLLLSDWVRSRFLTLSGMPWTVEFDNYARHIGPDILWAECVARIRQQKISDVRFRIATNVMLRVASAHPTVQIPSGIEDDLVEAVWWQMKSSLNQPRWFVCVNAHSLLDCLLRGVASPGLVLLKVVKNHNGFSLMGRIIVLAARVQNNQPPSRPHVFLLHHFLVHVKPDKQTRSFNFDGQILSVAETNFPDVWLETLQLLRAIDPKTYPSSLEYIKVWVHIGLSVGLSESRRHIGCSWYKCHRYGEETHTKMYMCMRCEAKYCGRSCQRRDWKEGDHKAQCQRPVT